MQNQLLYTIQNNVLNQEISKDRKAILQPLVVYIQKKVNDKQTINLNFICTHNSRRSHLAQIWAQFAAYYYNVQDVS